MCLKNDLRRLSGGGSGGPVRGPAEGAPRVRLVVRAADGRLFYALLRTRLAPPSNHAPFR